MGVEFKCNVNVGKDVTLDQLRNQGYKGFYVAIGAQESRRLQIEGEDAKGVYAGVDFLNKQPKDLGRVVVIGGGNVAVDCARVAIRNAASTTMISLEKEMNFLLVKKKWKKHFMMVLQQIVVGVQKKS